MNFVSNIWKHPKTSAAGLLIAVASVTEVFSQQGVSLGKVGTGTVVSLASALATALLGLLAKDPETAICPQSCKPSGTIKLSAWLLIALLVPLPWMEGCNAATVAQDIVNWTPSLQSAVATVDSTVALLAPADAPIFSTATVGFDAATNLLVSQAKAYLANPSASALARLQVQIVTLQQQVNSALLQAGKNDEHGKSAARACGDSSGWHDRNRNPVAGSVDLEQGASRANGVAVWHQASRGSAISQRRAGCRHRCRALRRTACGSARANCRGTAARNQRRLLIEKKAGRPHQQTARPFFHRLFDHRSSSPQFIRSIPALGVRVPRLS